MGVDAAGPGRLFAGAPEGDLPDEAVAQARALLDRQEEQARLAVLPVEFSVAVAGARIADVVAEAAPRLGGVEQRHRCVGRTGEESRAELDQVPRVQTREDARALDRDPADRPVEVDERDAAVVEHRRALGREDQFAEGGGEQSGVGRDQLAHPSLEQREVARVAAGQAVSGARYERQAAAGQGRRAAAARHQPSRPRSARRDRERAEGRDRRAGRAGTPGLGVDVGDVDRDLGHERRPDRPSGE